MWLNCLASLSRCSIPPKKCWMIPDVRGGSSDVFRGMSDSELPGHLPPRAGGKNRSFVLTLKFDRTYLCNGTWYQQSGKTCQSTGTPYSPKIWWTLVQKRLKTGWRVFANSPKFSHWERNHCNVLCSGTSLQSRTA